MSTSTSVPFSTPAGMRARAMDWLSVGEKLPLVVSPVPSGVCTFMCERITPLSRSSRPAKRTSLRRAASADFPLLLDADALNLLATHPVLARQVARRDAPTVLTPHPAEAARLLGVTTEAVQDDRVAAALQLARRFAAAVALKGCGTVVATADGRWWINSTGNPGLATAGSGDVLAGMALALLAQGWPAPEALLAAVHLHGLAADALVAGDDGPSAHVGIAAGDLIAPARSIFNRWIAALV